MNKWMCFVFFCQFFFSFVCLFVCIQSQYLNLQVRFKCLLQIWVYCVRFEIFFLSFSSFFYVSANANHSNSKWGIITLYVHAYAGAYLMNLSFQKRSKKSEWNFTNVAKFRKFHMYVLSPRVGLLVIWLIRQCWFVLYNLKSMKICV